MADYFIDLFYGVFDKRKVLAVDHDYEVLEGEWSADHTVILEFPNKADLKAWYESPEYQELLTVRASASDANIVLIHGR